MEFQFDWKKKNSPSEARRTQINLFESSNFQVWKTLIGGCFQQQQLASCGYQQTQPVMKIHTNACLRSKSSDQSLSNLDNFSCVHETMFKYNSEQDTFYNTTKPKMVYISWLEGDFLPKHGEVCAKKVPFDDMAFIEKENTAIYVHVQCCITFFSQTFLQKSKMSCQNMKKNHDFVRTPKCVITNRQHIFLIDLSKPPTSFWTPLLDRTWIQ